MTNLFRQIRENEAMSSIRDEFGDERVQDIVRRIKKIEKAGVFRILTFIRNNPHFYSEFDEVMSLHAFKDAAKIAAENGWIKKEERDRKHYFSLTTVGEKVTDLFLEILSNIP